MGKRREEERQGAGKGRKNRKPSGSGGIRGQGPMGSRAKGGAQSGSDGGGRAGQARERWAAGNMLYPLPAALVSCARPGERPNLVTVAWTGTVCTDPPMLYVSLRPERHSCGILRDTGEFTVNLATEGLAWALDYCGARSGRDVDKFRETGLTPAHGQGVSCPYVAESPVSIECRVERVLELGSHHMFLARVADILVDAAYVDGRGRLDLGRAGLLAYSHGAYYGLGAQIGTFGFSVRRKGRRGGAARSHENQLHTH